MLRGLIALAALLLTAPAQATPEPVAEALVARDGSRWTVDYRLLEPAPVWVFTKSILPRESNRSWRLETVRVLTPGVTLERLGNYDALVAANGNLPATVRLSFTPFFKDIEAGYDSAIALGGDAVALYADAFTLLPMRSRQQVTEAKRDSDTLPGAVHPTRLTFQDRAGPVLFKGKRTASATTDAGWAYVVFGDASPVIGPALTTIIDPRMPAWIADYLRREIPAIIADYSRDLGPAPAGQPTLLASWQGATPGKVSLGGSVLPGMVTMVLEGEGVATPNPRISNYARWFIAHEAAHFWLGQALGYSNPSESWITEGGADLLAFRATKAADPSFDIRARLSEARSECEPFLKKGGLASAYERPEDFRAYYACGALIALVAEKASGGDFGGFVRTLIQRHGAAGTVSRGQWLALLEERAPGRGLPAAVSELLDKRQADPAAALDRFIAATGIAAEFAPRPTA